MCTISWQLTFDPSDIFFLRATTKPNGRVGLKHGNKSSLPDFDWTPILFIVAVSLAFRVTRLVPYRNVTAPTGRVLNSSVQELKAVAVDLAKIVPPIQQRYGTIGSAIEAEIKKLDYTSGQLREQTANFLAQTHQDRWVWRLSFWAFLLFAGLLLGIYWEKSDTTSMIAELQQQIAQLRQTIKLLRSVRHPLPISIRRKGDAHGLTPNLKKQYHRELELREYPD